jgi:hypothetical protein
VEGSPVGRQGPAPRPNGDVDDVKERRRRSAP